MAPMTRSRSKTLAQSEGQSLGKQQQQMADGGNNQRESIVETSILAAEQFQLASSTREGEWKRHEIGEDARTNWAEGGGRGCGEERKVVPSACTVHPAARARAARTSFMSARAGSGKLPCCRSPASIRLVMARRCRSLSFVLSFSLSRSLSPRRRGAAVAAAGEVGWSPAAAGDGEEAKPRGRRCGGGGGGASPSSIGECGCFVVIAGAPPPPPSSRSAARWRGDLCEETETEEWAREGSTNTAQANSELSIPRIPPYPGRINTMEIKQLIQTRLGQERANRYFTYFKMFLSARMEKSVFDRLIIQTIGRENIRLHNHLLRSILRNASLPMQRPGAPAAK
uniref:Uncharacterized protein n=1 Tax=Leersia perrieri TaxID=77586 RepID=A0A0D9VBR5_9ORYZ